MIDASLNSRSGLKQDHPSEQFYNGVAIGSPTREAQQETHNNRGGANNCSPALGLSLIN